jgi:SAM-dependent methyltransferase
LKGIIMDQRFEQLRRTWDHYGEADPLWAILSSPGKRGQRWDIESFFAEGRRVIEGLLQIIADRFPDVPRFCALDFGCGVGRLTRPLAVHFDRVIGVDVAASMIRRARQLNSDLKNCEFLLNESDNLSVIDSGSVDFVFSDLVLQHIAPAYSEGYLREFVRILSPRGLVVCQVIDRPGDSLIGRLSRLAPGMLLDAYRRVRYGRNRIQIYAFPMARIHAVVRGAGGQVLHQEDIRGPDDRWKRKQYFVGKPPAC